MGRRKGQTIAAGATGWATPDNVAPDNLKSYLCEIGPRYCPICHSKCAFGERFMENRRKENAIIDARLAAFKRRMA